MNTPDGINLSRRQWLERVSLPVAAATLVAGAVSASAANAQSTDNGSNTGSPGMRRYDVRSFGAKGDGTTLDTVAVQKAIDTCHQDRGGMVVIPAGDFVVGTIELKSNVTLYLSAAGRLLGSARPEDYRAGNSIPKSNGNVVMISAARAENITIEGPGIIDGNGAKFFNGRGDNTGPGQKSSDGYFERPHLIVWFECKNIVVRGVTLQASAYHCMRVLACERVHFDGIRIYNRVNKNNDGFHFQNTQYAHVANCDVKCQDDGCALFGSCKFITVTNCTFSTRWSIFRFGGGEAENITVSNCVITDTFGSVIKMSARAGSRFENISFSNLIMKNVTGPITIGLQSSPRADAPKREGPAPKPGIVRNISFNGIRATVAAEGQQYPDMAWEQSYRPGERRTCITVNAVGDDVIENISFTDVHVTYEGGGTAEEAAIRDVPQVAGEYFEIGPRPAYGLYARSVRGLTLQNVRFDVTKPDLRPAVILDHVVDSSLLGVAMQGNPAAESVLRFIATRDTLLTGTRVVTPATVFLRVEGEASSGITVDGGDLAKAGKPLVATAGASESAVRLRI